MSKKRRTTPPSRAHLEIVEPKLLPAVAADEIVTSIVEGIADRGSVSIALSGGSTPGAIYRLLSIPPRVSEVDWGKVRLFLGDERWVPHEDTQSNFRMIQETLLSHTRERSPHVYPVDTSLPSPEEGAVAYEAVLRSTFGVGDDAVPEFDIVLLGLGEDGHTASLFPHSPLLAPPVPGQKPRLAGAVKNPHDGTSRISLTPAVIMAARRILFIVTGEAKSGVVKRVIEGNDPVDVIPARLYEPVQSRVSFLLDTPAASKLERHP